MFIEAEVELVISSSSDIPIWLFTQSSMINLWLFNSLRDIILHIKGERYSPTVSQSIKDNFLHYMALLLYILVFYTVIPLFLSDHHINLGL